MILTFEGCKWNDYRSRFTRQDSSKIASAAGIRRQKSARSR